MIGLMNKYQNVQAYQYIMSEDNKNSFNRFLGLEYTIYNSVLYNLGFLKIKKIKGKLTKSINEEVFKSQAILYKLPIEIAGFSKKEEKPQVFICIITFKNIEYFNAQT